MWEWIAENRRTISVVIPLHGGREDLRLCLDSLEQCADLMHEVIIVDNASPDDAAQEVLCRMAKPDSAEFTGARSHPKDETSEIFSAGPLCDLAPRVEHADGGIFRRWSGAGPARWDILREPSLIPYSLIPNSSNAGFAAACNQGIEASTSPGRMAGEIVLFLNSDTIVPRAGLIALIDALTASGSIAAAGPLTNYAGHGQQIAPTYTSLETMELFAEDFAARGREDIETDMLVGFCLAVRRSVLTEIGGFDERFGLGTFEDNDLCYRMRRAGYRLVIAANSFVHHSGSKTMQRMQSAGAAAGGNGKWYQESLASERRDYTGTTPPGDQSHRRLDRWRLSGLRCSYAN